jgi:hypothetical protein
MKTYDITLTILIILVFIVLFCFNILSIGIKNVKNNWPKYRCNPSVMPFAGLFGHDSAENFSYCIQNMQSGFMGYLLEPVHYSMSLAGNLGGEFTQGINQIRIMMSSIRNFITNIIQSVMGVFLNILIEFQKITIGIKDIIGKFIGMLATVLFMVDGTVKTMESAWNGPPGQLTRALCFKDNTKIMLQNGSLKEIKDLNLGDILKNSSTIDGIVKLKNWNDYGETKEQFYSLPHGENGEDILVTGRHLIWLNNKWDFVKNHPLAIKTDQSDKILYCLITDNHHISIGDHVFWDWEDTPDMIKDLK